MGDYVALLTSQKNPSGTGISNQLHITAHWLIPICLVLIEFLIVLFIWSLFSRYYHHSLPEKLFRFLTEKDKQKGKQAKTIQELSEKIKNYYDEKNLMLTALSHDIKTPLTEAILQLEILGNSELSESVKEKLLKINQIITSSLEYSKEPDKIHKQEKNLLDLINPMIQNYGKFDFPITLSYLNIDSEKNLLWPIEPSLFQRMLQNLLDNAKRYSSQAEIKLSLHPDSLWIEISDNGPGVPESLLSKLSTPYFRVDPSRSRETGGSGLGLAIVRKIAEIHRGDLTLKNLKPRGFRATIKLQR